MHPQSTSPQPRMRRAYRTCEVCGATFRPTNQALLRGGGKYCSRACFGARPLDPVARFWPKVDKTSSPHGCWLWTARKSSSGHGMFDDNGAHRFSWELHRGPIPDGLFVCHNCPGGDNPACVNPAHLWLGTLADNVADAVVKSQVLSGERQPNARLTADQAAEARALHAAGHRQIDIARHFGVHQSTISLLISGKLWRKSVA